MKNTGSSGASADGSTPSCMIMLRSRSPSVGKLDLPRHARADGIAHEFRRVTYADAVHPLAAAKGEGDDVAIGREAPPEPVGEAKPALAGAEQDLGRAERAGGKQHGLGIDEAWARILAVGRREIDAPAPLPLGDMAHAKLGEDLRAMRLGIGKIGDGDRILGADIAA